MSLNNVNTVAIENAKFFVDNYSKRFGLFNYTFESLENVENVIESFIDIIDIDDIENKERVEDFINLTACYVGEVIRKTHGGDWVHKAGTNEYPYLEGIHANNHQLLKILSSNNKIVWRMITHKKIHKRLKDNADSIPFYVSGIPNILKNAKPNNLVLVI